MAKQLKVGQTHHLDGKGEWMSSNPDAVRLYACYEDPTKTAGKEVTNGVDVSADAVTPEGEPAVVTLNGVQVLRVNVVPADPVATESVQGQDLAPASE